MRLIHFLRIFLPTSKSSCQILKIVSFVSEWGWHLWGYFRHMYIFAVWSLSLIDLDLDSRSQECEKTKTCMLSISQSFQSIWMEFLKLFRLVSVMNLLLILSRPLNIQGRKPHLSDFVKKKPFNVGLYADIYCLLLLLLISQLHLWG